MKSEDCLKCHRGTVPEPPTVRVKIFRLTHREPAEIGRLLESLLETAPPQVTSKGDPPTGTLPGTGMQPPAIGNALGLGALGLAGAAGVGGANGFGGGGMSWSGGTLGHGQSYRIAVDFRTKSLIVRGSGRNLQIAEDLIASLDLPAGKSRPPVKGLRLIKLRNAKAVELAVALKQLEYRARVAGDEPTNTLIVAGAFEDMNEIAEVINELDSATPKSMPAPATKTNSLKDADVVTGDPVEILNSFSTNPLQGELNYLGKAYEIAGRYYTVKKMEDKYQLILAIQSSGRLFKCYFQADEPAIAQKLAELRRNDLVIVKGLIARPDSENSLVLTHCDLLSVKKGAASSPKAKSE